MEFLKKRMHNKKCYKYVKKYTKIVTKKSTNYVNLKKDFEIRFKIISKKKL